jgi:hypothetical protein
VSDHSSLIAGLPTILRLLPTIPRRKLSKRDRKAPLKLEPGIKGRPNASLITGKSEPIGSVERPALMRNAVTVVRVPVSSSLLLKVSNITYPQNKVNSTSTN